MSRPLNRMNTQNTLSKAPIKAIIGLGNPGKKYEYTRHNIGFLVIDYIVQLHHATFKAQHDMLITSITMNGHSILCIKPQIFMNNSGLIMPWLAKQGIKAENILVIHDELDMPLGKIKIKQGGSARGHNGLKSIIAHAGSDFFRMSIGIDRPANKDDVPHYVLEAFKEPKDALEHVLAKAYSDIEALIG